MKKPNKTINNRGYIQMSVKGQPWLEHRYVWTQVNGRIPKGMQIHHINNNKRDNRIENLSLVTGTQNKQKKQGLGYCVRGSRYYAYRVINGLHTHLGSYGTPCGAVMASRMAYV